MPHTESSPILCITVDIEPRGQRANVSAQRSLESAARTLQSVLDGHGLPATWAMTDPAASRFADSLLTTSAAHELALLADASWASASDSRQRFVSQLSQQLLRARDHGIAVNNLALARGAVVGHADLLVKYGVRFVRDDPAAIPPGGWLRRFAHKSTGTMPPTPLRWGLWRLAPSICLPGSGFTAVRRCLDTAVHSAGLVTLVLDLNDLAAGGRPAMRLVDRVVAMMARRAERRALAIEVPRDLATRLLPAKQPTAARSILRPAA